MFIVSASSSAGMKVSEQPTIEEALSKAAEFMTAGMGHVGILAADGAVYTDADLDLLLEMQKAERDAAR